MAALFAAENPDTHDLYIYDEYLMGGKSIKQHAKAFIEKVAMRPLRWIGGAQPEDQWRTEFQQQGIPVIPPPISDVEVGISRVYAYHKNNQIFVFDTCRRYLDEKGSYARELDDNNEPTEKIEDKNTFHLMDAERVMVAAIYTLKNRVGADVLPLLSQAGYSRWAKAKAVGATFGQTTNSRWGRGRKY
jgi:hypothetical protein